MDVKRDQKLDLTIYEERPKYRDLEAISIQTNKGR